MPELAHLRPVFEGEFYVGPPGLQCADPVMLVFQLSHSILLEGEGVVGIGFCPSEHFQRRHPGPVGLGFLAVHADRGFVAGFALPVRGERVEAAGVLDVTFLA